MGGRLVWSTQLHSCSTPVAATPLLLLTACDLPRALPGLKDLNLTPDESGLSELLNMAYAQHEIVADTTSQMLEWFEQQPVAGAPDHH